MAINHTIGQNCLVKGGILRHNYIFCCSMIEGNVWAQIHHKVMHIHFANLKNPNVIGALGVWCKV
jgi:hypothetical protein